MTNAEIAARLDELIDAGQSPETAVELLVKELSRAEVGATPRELEAEVWRTLDVQAALDFLRLTPEYQGGEENGRRIFQRAQEICGGPHPLLADLQLAFEELSREGGLDLDEEDEPAHATPPVPQPQPLPRGIVRTGQTGTLTVRPEERARLANIPLNELRRLANRDRWANLDPSRAARLRQGFEAI